MLDNASLQALAERMLDDYDKARPGTVFGEGLRLEIEEAWQLQAAVAELREARGERVVGYKIGCVFKGNQEMMGLSHPAYGRLWSTEQHQSGVELRKANYSNPSMEAEFAITLSGAVTPGMKTASDLLPVIQSIHPVIEIHNLTMRGEVPHGHELLANNAILAGVVWGPPVTTVQDATTTDLKLIYDGETVDSWDGLKWPDEMITAIGWLAEKLDAQGKQLNAGDRLLMGAWGPPVPMNERSSVDVTSSAFGDASAIFV